MKRTQRYRKILTRWTAAAAVLFCTGCHNPFELYQRRHTGMDFYGEKHVTYYHYPGGAWFVPKHQKHCAPVLVEPPFHGFAATCWTQWPEPWHPCPPPPGMCAPGEEVIIEGTIETVPPGELLRPSPQGSKAKPKTSTPHVALQPPAKSMELQPEASVKGPAQGEYKFHGKHGFSDPDAEEEKTPSSAVAIELPTQSSGSSK